MNKQTQTNWMKRTQIQKTTKINQKKNQFLTDESDVNICPSTTDNNILDDNRLIGTEVEVKAPESCLWPNALQVCPFVQFFIK